MKINFRRHIPNCCSGLEAEEYSVDNLDELLEKEKHWITFDPDKDYIWACGGNHTLMISSRNSESWYVIGFVDGIWLSNYLPEYHKCYKKE